MDNINKAITDTLSRQEMTRNEIMSNYTIIYNELVGHSKSFLQSIHDILVSTLKKSNATKDFIPQNIKNLALVMQYPRRHFGDVELLDPFEYYLGKLESKTVSELLQYKI